jgi:hypothetical protein
MQEKGERLRRVKDANWWKRIKKEKAHTRRREVKVKTFLQGYGRMTEKRRFLRYCHWGILNSAHV